MSAQRLSQRRIVLGGPRHLHGQELLNTTALLCALFLLLGLRYHENMKFGVHVSIAGGIPNAPGRAASLGCEVFQIFSRSPRGGTPQDITDEVAKEFKNECKKHNQSASYIHTPYYINFASENKRIKHGSIEIVRTELERASQLGVKAVMTHLGSAKDTTEERAIQETAKGIAKALKGYKGSAQLLLELSAGSGMIIGDRFEELAAIIKGAEKILGRRNIIGVCLDTAHLFASGYDIRDKKSLNAILKQFDSMIGSKRLGVLHGNDSKVGLGEKKDRHEHIGKGKIGRAGFRALVNHSKLQHLDLILETPTDAGMKQDIKLLKAMRRKP
jgi:deoxyribonuclease IV